MTRKNQIEKKEKLIISKPKGLFDNYKFRPSMMPELMKNGKSKTDILSETAKSKLHEIYLEEVFGYKELISNKYLTKGTNREDEAIKIYQKVTGEFSIKNEIKLENEYLAGTPDLIFDDKIIDIKTNWSIKQFHLVNRDPQNKYFWQLASYRWLMLSKTGNDLKTYVANVLLDNDEPSIIAEVKKECYNRNLYEETEEAENQRALIESQIRKNNIYSLEDNQRIKIIEIEMNIDEVIDEMKIKLEACRSYLNSLTL